MGMTAQQSSLKLFNTPLEAGVRSVIILEAFNPNAFDIGTLSLLDYFVVHTADIGGPKSLHPELEARSGEFYVRRSLVEEGALLMTRGEVLKRITDSNGFSYKAHDTAAAMIGMMASPYNTYLNTAATWLSERASEMGLNEFLAFLRSRIDRWDHEITGQLS